MESKCKKCVGKYVCAGDILLRGPMCKRFHKALESKLQSTASTNKHIKKFSKTIEQVIEEVRGELESPNFHWEFVAREVYDILERELLNA